MGLSGREVLLVLRARDEATRTIGRVSGAMRRMDRDAMTSSTSMINAQKSTLRQLQTQLGDVNHAYSQTTASALARHREEMRMTSAQLAALGTRRHEIIRTADEQMKASSQMLRDGKITQAQYDKAQETRQRYMHSNLAAMDLEKRSIDEVRRTARGRYQEEVEGARRLHIEQKEGIRQSRIAAQDAIIQHQQRIDMIETERAHLRNRGQQLVGIGGGAMAAGAGMVYFGIQGVRAWKSTTDAAIDYEQQARRTLTQVDNNAVGLKRISNMGKEIADTVPVAFEEIQPALYDIFSSIDVGVGGAKKLLKQFSEDAVGGMTEVQTATRANLAIMNAYKLEVKDASKVSDFMFQLVRKGVGSYDEFAHSIGRAIPSARRAGQSYETLGGMMAFLTRNGLSAAMAATSSARALDALSHPTTAEHMKKIGIEVRDAAGEFRPLVDILDDMNAKFGDMTSPQRSKALYELFKGSGGTIQARRFFDNYFKNSDEFVQRTKEMEKATGAAHQAFKTMADSPGAKMQKLKNDWMLLRIELGEKLMPVAFKIIDWAEDMIDKWRALDPETRKTIVKFAALASGLSILLGIFTVVGGAALVLKGSINMLGWSAKSTVGKFGLLAGGISGVLWGLKELHSKSKDAHKTMGFLATAAGGALAGFAVGGPWGAAIGGVAGAIAGLASATGDSAVQFVKAKDGAKGYIDTLNQLTGATTKATRAAVYQRLMKDKVSESYFRGAVAAGAASRDIVSAAMGEKDAQGRLNQLYKDRTKLYHQMQRAYGDSDPRTNRVRKEAAALQMLNSYLKEEQGNLREASRRVREKAAAVGTWQKALKGLPKKVQTELKQMGYNLNNKQIKDLKKKYTDLTKKDWELILSLKNADTLKEIKQVKHDLEEVHKTKANLDPWKKGLLDAIRNGKNMADKGGKDVKKALEDAPGKARADLGYYQKSISDGTTTAKGIASSGGNSVGVALKSGVLAGVSGLMGSLSYAVSSAVNAAIAAGKHAADAHSPSRKMMKLGKDMSDGLTIGFRKAAEKDHKQKKHEIVVAKIVRGLFNRLEKEFRARTLKLADLVDEAKDLIDKKLDRMAKGLKGDALKAFNKSRGAKAKGLLHEVVNATEKDFKRLTKLQKRYESVMKRLSAARDKLNRLQEARKSYIDATKSSLRDYAFSFEKPTDVFGNEEDFTVAGISASLKEKLAQIKKFGSLLKKVAKRFPGLYQYVVAMGPVDGSLFAEALLQATAEEAAGINQMVTQINSQSASIAEAAGNTMYNAGIKAAEGLVKGLQDKAEDIRKIAEHLGELIAKAVKKALGIKSPSRVGIEIGKNFGGALAKSLHSQAKNVSRASSVLAQAAHVDLTDPNSTYSRPPVVGATPRFPVAGSAGGTQSGGKVIHQKIDVHTQEIDPRRHAAQLGWELASNYRI